MIVVDVSVIILYILFKDEMVEKGSDYMVSCTAL